MANDNSYSWIGGRAGSWENAANWEDLTTGTIAAVAPGIDNAATLGEGGYLTSISGDGSAAFLTTVGLDDVLGVVNLGSLSVGGSSELDISAGATVFATSASLVGSVVASGAGASFAVDGTLSAGPLSASDGATISANALAFSGTNTTLLLAVNGA